VIRELTDCEISQLKTKVAENKLTFRGLIGDKKSKNESIEAMLNANNSMGELIKPAKNK